MFVAEKDTLDIWVNGQRVPTTVRCVLNLSFEIFQTFHPSHICSWASC